MGQRDLPNTVKGSEGDRLARNVTKKASRFSNAYLLIASVCSTLRAINVVRTATTIFSAFDIGIVLHAGRSCVSLSFELTVFYKM